METIFDSVKLAKDFPFLIPKNFDESYYGDWTLLDEIPAGWMESFGIALCHELRKALIEANELETYEVLQAKEKFGKLRWYDNSNNPKVKEIVARYEYLSQYVCARCGSPATVVSTGWVLPFCGFCASSAKIESVSIGEHLKTSSTADVSKKAEVTINEEGNYIRLIAPKANKVQITYENGTLLIDTYDTLTILQENQKE